ncbi:MAG: ROK family protein [Microcella sp.]|uniref:ROK family protein n=1 Tax=Microcella sp. TaxID=1913979 RepID=UPI0024CC3E1D|nr:ROK family protein [Microcella sp.]UYN83390.1 MAG: ROK family protein [Microcella sp.]
MSAVRSPERVGVDIGGTKTHGVVLDAGGSVVEQWRSPTGFGPEQVVATAVAAVERLAELRGIAPLDFATVGIGIPGRVDSQTGHVSHAVNLGVDSLDLGPRLAERLGRPVHVENDVNAAALGAHHLVARRESRSLAYLNLGTGLAAGLVLDGALWRGARGVAGEIGHIPVDPSGDVCACGQRGCLETLASGSALARLWPEGSVDGRAPRAGELFAAAEAGDAAAVRAAERIVDNIAAAVRILVLTVDVDAVVIGGGLSSLGAPLLGGVRARLAADARTSPFLASLDLGERLLLVPRDVDVAAVGAALVGSTAHPHLEHEPVPA